MFGTVLLTFYTLILVYLLWRAASVPLVVRIVPRWSLIPAGVLLWAAFFLGRYYGHGGRGKLAALAEYVGMNSLGVVFLAFLAVLAADLITVFGLVLPRWAPALRGGALIIGGLLAGFALIQGHRAPAVVRYEVPVKGLPAELDGTVLVAISDTHLGQILGEEWLEARVQQVSALSPDIIALAGDIFEGHGGPPDGALATLRRLSAPMGVHFVSGNHEGHGDGQANGEVLERAGFQRLEGIWKEVQPGLVMAGVSDLTARRRRRQGGDPVGAALEGRPEGGTVFLSHSPLQAERAAQAGAGLMISGHTHGGQIWPFNYLVGRRYPLVAGLYDVDGMAVIVSRGAGTWGPRMRLFRRGEIVHVTLRRPGTGN
ncbi:MAG: metallophosphoesterase [bacterium]|nr:MAG: metallophosphoesterase [bacterium]